MKITIGVKIGVVAVMATAWIFLGHGHALALDKSDVLAASKQQGCSLIPYDAAHTACVDGNAGLHLATACNANGCQQSAGVDANALRKAAWQNCVAKRTQVNGAFKTTINKLESFKRGNIYKGWEKKCKDAVKEIIRKIKAGQPNHRAQSRNADGNVVKCERFVE